MGVNFKKLFQDSRIKFRDTVNRNWVNVCCPYCEDDSHFNGGFHTLQPRYNCWRCGSHPMFESLSKILNLPEKGVRNLISSYEIMTTETGEKIAKGENLKLPGYRFNDGEIEYLKERGFDIEYLENKFHIKGGGIAGDWSYRILIPIYYNNLLVSWTGRSILPRKMIDELKIPRYKNLSIEESVINPKEIFFNLDNSTKDSVILVEGPFDVLRMGDDCICSLGTSVTHAQELFLTKRYKKVFIAFDPEVPAQKKAHHIGMNLISIGMEVEIVDICSDYNKEDPGALSDSEVKEIKKELGFI